MLLFQFNRKDKMVLHPDAVKLTKYLKKIGNDELRYIALAYDYKSVFRLYPQVDRKRMACRDVWGSDKEISEIEEKLVKEIEEYMSFMFDFRRDLRDKYIQKIQILQGKLLLEEDPVKIKKLDEAILGLEKRTVTLQHEIDKEEESEEIKGGGELSYLEKWQEVSRQNKRNNRPIVVADRNDLMDFDDDKYEDK